METGLPAHLYAFQLPRSADAIYLGLYKKDVISRVGEKSFFTSTTPGRIYDIYQIASIIPNLRIVFVKRDVDDVIYRMYRTLYKTGKAYSYNLDAAREYVNWYYSMQDKYAKLLPHFTMTVNYEELVVNPTKIANEARQFCNIPSQFGELPNIGDDRDASKNFNLFLENRTDA